MSTTPVRQSHAAAQATAAQAAAESRRHETHARPHHHGAGHRGQFGGFVFRLGRAPSPATPRRPAPLRRRPPRPPGPNPAGMEHEGDHGLALNMPLLPQSSAVEDEERAASLQIDTAGWHEDSREGMREEESRQGHRGLQWRVGSQSRPDAEAVLLSGLQAAGGTGAQALWEQAAPGATLRHEDLARALVGALVGVNSPGAPAQPGPGVTTLQLAAMRLYLTKGLEAGIECGPFATLAGVKRALLESLGRGTQRPAAAVPDEAQQNRNLLLPLKLLNADRPRTEEQVRQACSRIELSCQAALTMGKALPSA
ncbi:hypothetical protein [Methylibium rhizosphaerae]|uniref:hypothetical protein n=1 Tax=Methylibium rhizosphaerae TaxID=2570323 RepID=UPI00112B0D8A|nr:hypothetical protein [Methylibium rhizosphaerae]